VNPVFRFVLAFVGLALTARPACPTVLFLNHFDQALDGDHSYYGQPKATVEGLTLTADGAGHPFEAQTRGARWTRGTPTQAIVTQLSDSTRRTCRASAGRSNFGLYSLRMKIHLSPSPSVATG